MTAGAVGATTAVAPAVWAETPATTSAALRAALSTFSKSHSAPGTTFTACWRPTPSSAGWYCRKGLSRALRPPSPPSASWMCATPPGAIELSAATSASWLRHHLSGSSSSLMVRFRLRRGSLPESRQGAEDQCGDSGAAGDRKDPRALGLAGLGTAPHPPVVCLRCTRPDGIEVSLEAAPSAAVQAGGCFVREHELGASMFVLRPGSASVLKRGDGHDHAL